MIRRRRLLWQLYPSYLLLVLAVVLAAGWYGSRTMRLFHMNQVQENLLHQAYLLAPRLQPFLDPLRQTELDALCKRIGREVPIRITVVLPDGTVAADSEANPATMENHATREEIQQALRSGVGTAVRVSGTIDRRMMYLALPMGNAEIQGVVRIAIALTAIEEQLRALRVRITQGGIVIALIAALVCLIISRRISRPIEEMRRGAARFAGGDLTHRLVPPDISELAELSQAMNQMAQELEQRIQSIVRQRSETEAVLACMAEGVLALDGQERILHLNAAAARVLNGRPERLQGRSIQEVVRSRELHRMVRDTLSHGKTADTDIVLYHQEREQVLHTRSTPLSGSQGQPLGVLLVMNDVTQLRRLETMRSDFAANVSHEIKTPLTAIQGFVETLAQGSVEDPQEAQRFLEIIHKHVRRLGIIIDDLMQLAHLERGEQIEKTRFQPVSIENMLNAAVQLCRTKADEKAISIQIRCPVGLTARIDEVLMEQAVVNLLDNAIKYSSAESHVYVDVEGSSETIWIKIKDQGMGIAKQHLPRLFERFYRVDKARSRSVGGSGLGLAIVKHIVQAHRGQVGVESVQGQGSIFTIEIPK